MSVQKWDDETLVVHLGDDPVLSEDMGEVNARLNDKPRDVVLDFSDVGLLTSSGISALLRLRKRQAEAGRRLVLCSPRDTVWSVFLTTGIDTLFEFAENVTQALTRIQSERT
ncbi:MAG: STAS domain-containing protein [Phycisphaerae bacterium]